MSEEVYNNPTVENIIDILKNKIASRKPFKVRFESDSLLHVSISYTVSDKTFKLLAERFIDRNNIEKKEVAISIPDDYIRGNGTLFKGITDTWVTFSTFSYSIEIWREKISPNLNYTVLFISGK